MSGQNHDLSFLTEPNPFTKSPCDHRKLTNYSLSNSARNIRRSHPTITHTDPTNHDELSPYLLDRHSNKRQKGEISQCGPYLGDRVIRLQRLLDLNSSHRENATTIAPAPTPPHSLTTAHIGKKFSPFKALTDVISRPSLRSDGSGDQVFPSSACDAAAPYLACGGYARLNEAAMGGLRANRRRQVDHDEDSAYACH
ncbi:hypothetical protein EDB89DRAFT_1904600 [Lactarius sanguifluus]|nr:hypothetical protein EDB89DRAFT_1904600 [Lactarius sanguifluus]